MLVTMDIASTWRGPRRVMRRLLAMGQREDRALAFLMGFCLLAFTAEMPALARKSYLEGLELNPLLGGALLGTVVILPLLLYGVAAASHLLARILGGRGSWYGARLALFWSLLAASPLLLLRGLVAGMIGPGAGLTLVDVLWLAIFLWFWASCLFESERADT